MASLVDDGFSIIIDDLKFTLISKSIPDFKGYMFSFNKRTGFIEDRKKIIFEVYQVSSKNLIGRYSAYTSVSELGIWRVCFLEPGQNGRIYKFDNYIQATLIDIRLQMFINEKFNLLPFVTVKDATGTKQIFSPEYLKKYPDIANDYTYIDGVNPNGAIGCTPAESDSLTNISNRFIRLFVRGLITIQQKSMFLEENYNLIQESYTKITEYDTQLDNFQAHVEIYEIQAIKKEKSKLNIPPNIIFQIGKFILDVIPVEERIHREGYYIFNMKLPEAKINKFGLYDHYISGTFINPYQGKASYKTEEDYITKPLNYIEQASITSNEIENIKSRYYFFTAYKNEIQFPIKQIIQFTGAAASSVPQAQAKSNGGYKRSKKKRKGRKTIKSRNSYKYTKNKKSKRIK